MPSVPSRPSARCWPIRRWWKRSTSNRCRRSCGLPARSMIATTCRSCALTRITARTGSTSGWTCTILLRREAYCGVKFGAALRRPLLPISVSRSAGLDQHLAEVRDGLEVLAGGNRFVEAEHAVDHGGEAGGFHCADHAGEHRAAAFGNALERDVLADDAA